MTARIWVRTVFIVIFATGLMLVPSAAALAVICGGEGNDSLRDPGWPKGTAKIFNTKSRIAWWEGPPFGGGQWHAECRGDATALTAILADFAKLDVQTKRVVLHDGVGHSFWLSEPEKREEAKMDWRFMVWVPAKWHLQRRLVGDDATDPDDTSPPAQIDVYTGGIAWALVEVPTGLTIIDRRLEAHGFTRADGVVLQGNVFDMATNKPLAANMRLERIEVQPKGGYVHRTTREARTDAMGRWVLKKVVPGWYRVVIDASGFVPRVVGQASVDEQPRWLPYNAGLSRPSTVTGRITDNYGQPLAGVQVSIGDVTADGRSYHSPADYSCTSGADGQFRLNQVPIGHARLWAHKAGYTSPENGPSIIMPAAGVVLRMMKAGHVFVTVGSPPVGFIVRIEPEGGEVAGKFAASGTVGPGDAVMFKHVPPGRYVVRGQSNAGAGVQPKPITVDVTAGQIAEVKLQAK